MTDRPPTTEVRTFAAADGSELAYVAHLPDPTSRKPETFLYLHGIESHAGWFETAAHLLAAAGHPVFCLDRRGSGLNRETRGFAAGHLPRHADLLDDLHRFVLHLRATHGADRLVLIGLSWGGKYALAYDVAHPGEAAGIVLITPGIKPKVGPSLIEKLAILRDAFLSPGRQHRLPIEPEMFTTTPEPLEFIRHDPLRLHTVSAAFLWQSHRFDRLLARATDHSPALVVLAGHDRIIDNAATRRFFARHPGQATRLVEYADQTHSIQLDAPQRLVAEILAWLEAVNDRR